MAVALARTRKTDPESRIDLTPMLDVVFILLIFFVVTAILYQEASLPLASQPPTPQPLDPQDTPENILVVISPDNQLRLNGNPVAPLALRSHMARVLAGNPQAAVIIRPAADSRAELLVHVADVARLAGVENIQVSE